VRPVVEKVTRFRSLHAWANRVLRIDLDNMDVDTQETEPYLPEYLGARGLAARICWQEYAEPVGPFEPSNPLMIFPGALAGSRAPYSGRISVCAFSPQAYPHPWFTRSNVGGFFGGELKRAGYDGIVVIGAASTPARIAIRDDEVAVLAEGGWAAASAMHLGEDLARQRYPGWGHTAHCDPFGWGEVTFPYWLVSALQWSADTRDPFNSGHGYLWAASAAERAAELESETEREAALDRIRALGQRVYHSAHAVDPRSGYEGKAYPGYYQTLRAVIKDCLPVDAHFPLIYRENAPDLYWRLHGIEGIGEIEGPSVEYHLFCAGTGIPWTEEEFIKAAERVLSLERALQVRHWARDRQMDESILPYFERTEPYCNPFLGRRYALDQEQFRPVMDEFYALHSWDVERGWPTQDCLRELGIEDVYKPMMDGADRAQRKRTMGGIENGQYTGL
jgi:hypothetical protein